MPSALPWLRALGATLLTLALAPAFAASTHTNYPTRPIKMVVAAPTGGLPDVIARIVAQHMTTSLGQAVVVENKPSAGGIIATESVAKAAPDGYTVLLLDLSPLTINPTLYKKLPYDAATGFAPVRMLGIAPLFLVTNPNVPAKTFQELVAMVKAAPGKHTYGTIGVGSLHHIAFEEMKAATGMDILHVPFREQPSGPVVAGQVDMILAGLPSIEGFVRANRLNMIAVSTSRRAPQAPSLPTLSESGLPGYDVSADIGVIAPKGTPPDVIHILSSALADALKQPDTLARFNELGIQAADMPADAYAAHIRQEMQRFARSVTAAGLAGSN
jgi:tripartite-type tricarboxylate transporter receptor subunit TctC